jgi:sugar lactone lactonase YvrE
MREPHSIVADTRCHTGEGPLYHPDRGVVYWVDIPRGSLLEYDPIDDDYAQVLDYDGAIGGFTIQMDGDLLLFCDRGRVVHWSPDDGLGDPVVESVEGEAGSRFNDVIADPAGRVFAGTMPTDEAGGTLYRLDTDGSLATVETDVAIPNGLGFTPDREQLYFTETNADAIYRYDYDESTGAVSNREVFVDTSDVTGRPDGMTVDADGDVWSAIWDGGRLVRYASDGTERERLELPAKKVSALTFGGPEYETAYVTTALGPGDGEAGSREEEGTGAGALLAVDTGVTGVPEFRSQIDV